MLPKIRSRFREVPFKLHAAILARPAALLMSGVEQVTRRSGINEAEAALGHAIRRLASADFSCALEFNAMLTFTVSYTTTISRNCLSNAPFSGARLGIVHASDDRALLN